MLRPGSSTLLSGSKGQPRMGSDHMGPMSVMPHNIDHGTDECHASSVIDHGMGPMSVMPTGNIDHGTTVIRGASG